MVPPIESANNINADHIDVNVSDIPRVDITAHDINANTPVKPKIEYHHPAISRLEEPPQSESASNAVYVDKEPPICLFVCLLCMYFVVCLNTM